MVEEYGNGMEYWEDQFLCLRGKLSGFVLCRWSFASLSVQHPSLRKTLHEFGIGRSAQLSAIDLASIAWSLALLQWHGDQMMEACA